MQKKYKAKREERNKERKENSYSRGRENYKMNSK